MIAMAIQKVSHYMVPLPFIHLKLGKRVESLHVSVFSSLAHLSLSVRHVLSRLVLFYLWWPAYIFICCFFVS